MKPFNLEAAKRGEKVVTRDGSLVDGMMFNARAASDYNVRIAGWVDGILVTWNELGLNCDLCHDDDLFMATVKHERTIFVVLTGDSTGTYFGCWPDADEYVKRFPKSCNVRIQRVEIGWEE
jgi:hypothetical protein